MRVLIAPVYLPNRPRKSPVARRAGPDRAFLPGLNNQKGASVERDPRQANDKQTVPFQTWT